MLIIGLTGGIASGKSTVSNILGSLGAIIVDTDEIARQVVEPRCKAWKKIVETFGKQILAADGNIDRLTLGEIIFNDQEAKKQLDEIIHPIIREEMLSRLAELRKQHEKIVVLDVPLLFECGWQEYTDYTCVVYVDDDTQTNRLMRRNNLTRRQAASRITSQMNMADKVRLADYVIDNCGGMADTEKQVRSFWRQAAAGKLVHRT